MWWMGVTSWSFLDARVALRLAKSSWVVIRPRFRRWPGMGMGAASAEATWEGMVVGVRWVFGSRCGCGGRGGGLGRVRLFVGENRVGNEAGYLLMWQVNGKVQVIDLLVGKVEE
jgi:hypothetical protein